MPVAFPTPSATPVGPRLVVDNDPPSLTGEQELVRRVISKFITGQDQRVFTTHGLAGTGKTFVAAAVARRHRNAHLCAPTGRAAYVLSQKTGMRATTVHQLLYKLEKIEEDKRGREKLHFVRKHADADLFGGVMLLDEASMVDTKMAEDILRSGLKVVAFGDPGQLPPVNGPQFFNTPTMTLRTIHRQALESPIIRQAHAVRNGGQYEADGPAFRVVDEPTDDEALAADAILCWRNDTRHYINSEVRRLRGIKSPLPQAGEPVLCFRNAARFNVWNGGVYTLLRTFSASDTTIVVDVEGKETEIPKVEFEGITPKGAVKFPTTVFGFGYALTVHKAQGSEFPFVILVDEVPTRMRERTSWLYTGITRAAERIMVVRTEGAS